jgi:hypothetical protein
MPQLHAPDPRCHSVEHKPDPRTVPDTYPKGRVCPCGRTLISIYNPNDYCWQCVQQIDRYVRHATRIRWQQTVHQGRPLTQAEVAARLEVIDQLRDHGYGWAEVADALDVASCRSLQDFYTQHRR